HANENRGAEEETEEAHGSACEHAGGSDPLGSGLAMLTTRLDPAPHGRIVLRAACVERNEQPDRKCDGPGGPVQDVRRLGQNFRHGSTEAQSKKDAAKDCDDGPGRPHILLRRHVFNRGFTLGGLGLHPRLAWANGVIEIALSPVLWRWTGWGECAVGVSPGFIRPMEAEQAK